MGGIIQLSEESGQKIAEQWDSHIRDAVPEPIKIQYCYQVGGSYHQINYNNKNFIQSAALPPLPGTLWAIARVGFTVDAKETGGGSSNTQFEFVVSDGTGNFTGSGVVGVVATLTTGNDPVTGVGSNVGAGESRSLEVFHPIKPNHTQWVRITRIGVTGVNYNNNQVMMWWDMLGYHLSNTAP